ncbi:MAG: winged helix-turn-helix domain-containing protein [Candidatus Hodarchaeota archaeon]
MSKDNPDPTITALFESAAQIVTRKKKWEKLGYSCDPCDPLLPLNQPKAFYGEKDQRFRDLIANIIDFIQEPKNDVLLLKGPQGSGKTIFAQIFKEYSQQLNIVASYQDAATFFVENVLQTTDTLSFSSNIESEDVIFLDNAFHLHKTIRKLLSMKTPATSNTPKIIAIMDSSEFEVYRRLCIQKGDKSYQYFLSMPYLNSINIRDLLQRRISVCYGKQTIPVFFNNIINEISTMAFGNPGLAIRILEEALKFSRSLEDLRFSFGIDPRGLNDFPPSKSPILREILVREVQNEFLSLTRREYLIHKDLTHLMNKTKSTISHHLGDLLSLNLIYEQTTARDKREKAYRPNKTIIGILEHLAFERFYTEDALATSEGINREK